MNNIQQERHCRTDVFDVVVKISKRRNREKPYNYYHWQDYFEVIYVIDGSANLIVEGKQYILTPNALALINPYELHMTTQIPNTNCNMLVVQFNIPDPEKKNYGIGIQSRFISVFLSHSKNKQPVIYFPYENCDIIQSLMNNILREAKYREHGYDILLKGYVVLLIGYLSRMKKIETDPPTPECKSLSIEEVCRYIDDKCTAKLSLAEVAGKFGYSPVYFSKLFLQITGHNFRDYVDYTLMRKAQRCLINEGKTKSQVSELLNYSTPSSFNRAYKRMMEKFNSIDLDPTIVKKVDRNPSSDT